MYGRRGRCRVGSAVDQQQQEISAGREIGLGRNAHLAKAGLMLSGCAAALLALSVDALGQSTLPTVTVEGKAAKPKSSSAKGAPKAAPAQAAEQTEQSETAATRDKVAQETVYKTPASVSSASKAELDTFGQIDTGDVIRAMPGSSTRESPQNAGLAVNIRGLEGSGRVNMMIDGVRQNFRFSGHEAQGFVYVDPALLAGVDISRGAVSTAGGAGALVGSANLRTLGIDDIIKPGNSTGVITTTTWGSNGQGFSEMLGAAARAGGVAMGGAISHHEPNEYKNGDGLTVPFTGQTLTSGLFKMDFNISSEQSLKLGAVLYDNDFFANSYLQNVKSDTYTLKYAYKPRANPLVDFAFNASANSVRMEYFHDSVPSNGLGSSAGRIIDDQGMGFDVSNTSRFRFGSGIKVEATYGYEYFGDDVDASNRILASRGGGPNPSGEARISGAFSQTKFSYGIYDLIGGLRYDTYSLKGSFDADPFNPVPHALTPLDISGGRLDPKITLAAQITNWLQPYATYSEAFRAPTLSETMFGGSHPGGGAAGFSANPFLEPEVQKGWEFGANIRQDRIFTRNDQFRFKAAYFTMDVQNYITGCDDPNAPGFIQFCNAPGKSQVDGVELQGTYDAGYVFAGLSYTYNHSKLPSQVDGAGAASFLPEHTAVLTGGMRFFDQKLTIGSRVSMFSESDVGAPNVGSFYAGPLGGYTLVDLFSSYKFDNGLELGLTATNLFNVSYTPALSTPIVPQGPITPTNCFGTNLAGCNDSGRGRTVLVTARTQF